MILSPARKGGLMHSFATISIGILTLGVTTGCGGGGEGEARALSSQEAYQDFFWDYCLPLAQVFTVITDDSSPDAERRAATMASCPDGGTADYDMTTGVATLTDCSGSGITTSGTISVTLIPGGGGYKYSANLSGGTITVSGAFSGTATIYSGTMGWEVPVADATTYWQLDIDLDGVQVCIWSGAKVGPCP
jgi:hypothetical protein